MPVDEIEALSKKLHKLAEMFEMACKMGEGFEAFEIIGSLYETMPALRTMAKEIHGKETPDWRSLDEINN